MKSLSLVVVKRCLLALIAVFVCLGIVYLLLPNPELTAYQSYSRAFFDKEGKLLRVSLSDDQRYRLFTPLKHISPHLQQATILYEDKNFYSHLGIDLTAMAGAIWRTYVLQSRRVGASTIPMQVARLRWKLNTKTIVGKFQQMFRAIQLSKHYSREQILESYFNMVSYGRNIEGIGTASLIYFNKNAAELSPIEAMTLAVIPQNPNKRNPTSLQGREQIYKARKRLFENWTQRKGKDDLLATQVNMQLAVRNPERLPFLAPHLVDDLTRSLPKFTYGRINTTLDLSKQYLAETIVKTYLARKNNQGLRNAAVLLLNHHTMEVEALVGSENFHDISIDGQVNGTRAKRSPGSALKPFVYALAMDQGLIHPMTLLRDAPRRFGGFTPENFDKKFLGPVFARDALITSRNLPAVTLQSRLTKQSFYDFLKRAKISQLKNESHYGLSLALGGAEVTMEELIALYAMLVNGGRFEPIKKIRGRKRQGTDKVQLLSPEASYLILDILKDNPAPVEQRTFGHYRNIGDVAWKTGTSYAFRDAWAVGLSGDYVVAVWVGDFRGNSNPAFVGRKAAGPLLFEIFAALQSNRHWRVDQILNKHALNLRKAKVCANTGDLAGKYCPRIKDAWFIPGVSPIKVSTIHQAIPISKQSGLRHCWHQPGLTELKVFEFWPSDFSHIFQAAGISLKQPPAYEQDCLLNNASTFGQRPTINTPQSDVVHIIRYANIDQELIPFMATVDADVKEQFWFLGDNFLGKSKPNHPYYWKPKAGEFNISVVDDQGRAKSALVKVIIID